MLDEKTTRIRALNDQLRTSLSPRYGRVLATSGLLAVGNEFWWRCMEAVRAFTDFNQDNDPHGERDFGSVSVDDRTVFWKIDYYQKGSDFETGAEDPSNAATTDRVMTVMLAEEY